MRKGLLIPALGVFLLGAALISPAKAYATDANAMGQCFVSCPNACCESRDGFWCSCYCDNQGNANCGCLYEY